MTIAPPFASRAALAPSPSELSPSAPSGCFNGGGNLYGGAASGYSGTYHEEGDSDPDLVLFNVVLTSVVRRLDGTRPMVQRPVSAALHRSEDSTMMLSMH